MQAKTLITITASVLGTALVGAIVLGAYIVVVQYNDAIRTKTEIIDSIKKASKACQDEEKSLAIVPQGNELAVQCIKIVQATSTKQ